MTNRDFLKIVAALGLLLFLFLVEWRLDHPVEAQSPQEVAPYLVGTAGSTKIYKLVHQGCELFVAENYQYQINHGDAVGVSISTGRGCK